MQSKKNEGRKSMSFTIQKEEITFELTDYCDNNCKYCSSDAKSHGREFSYLNIDKIRDYLQGYHYKQIHLSGGEPLAHPEFYFILKWCKEHADDVIVHTNALTHICYNSNVIDGIYIETNLTLLPNVDKIHILKRVEQGREKTRPEVKFSGNWQKECSKCGHVVIRADGKEVESPCKKEMMNNG